MKSYTTEIGGVRVEVIPTAGIIRSEEDPPTAELFEFQSYKGKLGERFGKWYVGQHYGLHLTLEQSYLGEWKRLPLLNDEIIDKKVIGAVQKSALEGPKVVFGIPDPVLVTWHWKPDGVHTHKKGFVVSRQALYSGSFIPNSRTRPSEEYSAPFSESAPEIQYVEESSIEASEFMYENDEAPPAETMPTQNNTHEDDLEEDYVSPLLDYEYTDEDEDGDGSILDYASIDDELGQDKYTANRKPNKTESSEDDDLYY